MDYEKQTKLSESELEKLNINNKYKIINIPTYPENNTHLQIRWGIPIEITRNEDSFWLDPETSNKENYWVVYGTDRFYIEPEQFKELEDAVIYALRNYSEWLHGKGREVEDILDNIKG